MICMLNKDTPHGSWTGTWRTLERLCHSSCFAKNAIPVDVDGWWHTKSLFNNRIILHICIVSFRHIVNVSHSSFVWHFHLVFYGHRSLHYKQDFQRHCHIVQSDFRKSHASLDQICVQDNGIPSYSKRINCRIHSSPKRHVSVCTNQASARIALLLVFSVSIVYVQIGLAKASRRAHLFHGGQNGEQDCARQISQATVLDNGFDCLGSDFDQPQIFRRFAQVWNFVGTIDHNLLSWNLCFGECLWNSQPK